MVGPGSGRQFDLVNERETDAGNIPAKKQQHAIQNEMAWLDGALDVHDVYGRA